MSTIRATLRRVSLPAPRVGKQWRIYSRVSLHLKILFQGLDGFAPERDYPLFPPFAENTHRPGQKIDPFDIKPGQLRDPSPEE